MADKQGKKEGAKKTEKVAKKRSPQNFYTYIYRVLKKVYPDIGLSGSALPAMNNLVWITIEKIMFGVNQIMFRTGKKTIGAQEIKSATRLVLREDLMTNAIKKAEEAVKKYKLSKEKRESSKEKSNPVSRNESAGLIFPVTRIQTLMMSLSTVSRKTDSSAVFFAAVCEYLVTEVLVNAGRTARENKRVRIIPRHIMMAVKLDPELSQVYRNAVFAGGVVPNISSKILPKPKKQKKTEPSTPAKKVTSAKQTKAPAKRKATKK